MEVSTFTEYLSISAKIAQDDWRTKSRNQGLNISYAPRQTKKSPKRKEKLVHKYQMEVTRKGATLYHSWTGKAHFHEARRKESRIEWTREVKKKELTRLVRDRDPQKIVWGNASGSCFYCVFVFFFFMRNSVFMLWVPFYCFEILFYEFNNLFYLPSPQIHVTIPRAKRLQRKRSQNHWGQLQNPIDRIAETLKPIRF